MTTEARRIITVDIGRSTWQGYEGDEPVVRTVLVWDSNTGGLVKMAATFPAPNSLNIINLGEGL